MGANQDLPCVPGYYERINKQFSNNKDQNLFPKDNLRIGN